MTATATTEMDSNEERIQEAEIVLRGSGDTEQRALMCDFLRRVADSNNPARSRRARELLDLYCERGEAVRDRELAEYERRLAAVQGLTDDKLLELLKELKEKYHIAARMLPAVVKKLQAWVADAIVHIEEFDEAEVALLNRFVDIVSSVEIYHADLKDLRGLRNALFRLRYAEVSRAVHESLGVWDDAKAWRSLEELGDPLANFAEDFASLQAKIYKVSDAKKKVSALLETTHEGEPDGWPEVRSLLEYASDAARSLAENDIPESWRGQLEKRKEDVLATEARFIEKQAAAAATSKDVRAFWAEYENLPPWDSDARLEPRPEWFKNFLEHVGARARADVLSAKGPDDLDEIASRLKKEKFDLPELVRGAVEPLLEHVTRLSDAWRAMRAGDEFPAPADGLPATPEAFEKESAVFGARLERIRRALARLDHAEGQAAEQICTEAMGEARAVLAEQPGHMLADRLVKEAGLRLAGIGVEAALAIWDFGRLAELCRPHSDQWPFSYYVEHDADLRLWLERAVTRESFVTSEAAQLWWENWKTAKARLPQHLPPALQSAMRREEEKRGDEWGQVLGELIKRDDLSPEECENILLSLRAGPEDLPLRNFQQGFEQKAKVGRALRHIGAGEWNAARRIIDSLDETLTDARRLKITLEVERARLRGVEALASVFKSQWGTVKAYFKDAPAPVLLLRAIEDAWRLEREEAIPDLRHVARRVLASEQEPAAVVAQIRSWEEWFTVVEAVKNNDSAAGLRQLVSYVREGWLSEESLRARIERLVKHWQRSESENLVMLAVADRMFDWLSLNLDPVNELESKGDAVADDVLKELEKRDDLEPARLGEMQLEVNSVGAEWRRLGEYLDILGQSFPLAPRAARPVAPSAKFQRAKSLLANLISARASLEELSQADLREGANRDRLETVEGLLRRDLRDVRARQKLLDQAESLSPLSKLNALEKNLFEEASRCGSERDADFYQPGLFTALAARIRGIVERFQRAGLRNGPMWRKVSDEYCSKVYRLACIYAARPAVKDLKVLAEKADELDAREREFRDKMDKTWDAKPSLGGGSYFNPAEHEDFLRLFPQTPPLARRDYLYFKYRYAEVEPLKSIIIQSRERLPAWVRKYLDEGIPSCADEV